MTYNLSDTILNVVCSNVVARDSGTDYNHFLPSIILCADELRRVHNLSLETFLCLRRGCEFRISTPSSWSAYLSLKVGDIGISRQPKSNDDVGRVKDSHCSVGSTATNGNVPLSFLILPYLLYESGSPDVQLQRLGVEFQPISKLAGNIYHNEHVREEINTPWEPVYTWASMTGMAGTEARCALFTPFHYYLRLDAQ